MNLRMALQQVSFMRQDLKSLQVKPKLKYCSGLSCICLSFKLTTSPKFLSISMSIGGVLGLMLQQSSSSHSSLFLKRPTVSCFRSVIMINYTYSPSIHQTYHNHQLQGPTNSTKNWFNNLLKQCQKQQQESQRRSNLERYKIELFQSDQASAQFHFIRLHMKSDLTWKSIKLKANCQQLNRMKSLPREKKGGLEQRESMCRFMRMLQQAERGNLDAEIHKQHSKMCNPSPINIRKGGKSWSGSIVQSRRVSRCLIHPENDKILPSSPVHKESQRSLIIKNLHFSSSKSKKELKILPLNQIILEETHHQEYSKRLQRPQSRGLIKSRRHSKRNRNISIQQTIKTKPQNNDDDENSTNFRRLQRNFLRKQSQLKNLKSINVMLEKSLPFRDLPNLQKKIRTQQDDVHLMQQSLFKHQSDYLKIKRFQQNSINGNKLYNTQNPKIVQQQECNSFRKYSQTQAL